MEETVPVQRNGAGIRHFLVDVLETVVISLLLFIGINALTVRIRVDGSSMIPTFHDGEFVLVETVTYRFREPQRGEVIVFNFPRNPSEEYIKRVIGLPGDQIDIRDGSVLVNGEALDEPYIAASPQYELDFLVSEDEVFVLGDNRNNSSDSHNWGPVPLDYIVGKAVMVYWPLTQFGLVDMVNAADAQAP